MSARTLLHGLVAISLLWLSRLLGFPPDEEPEEDIEQYGIGAGSAPSLEEEQR